MKAYGKNRSAQASRKLRGTSMACPCCVPGSTRRKSQTKTYKKTERQKAKKEAKVIDAT